MRPANTSQEQIYEDMTRRIVDEAIQQAQMHSPHDMMLFRKTGGNTSPELLTTLLLQANTSKAVTGRYGITLWSSSLHPETTPHVRRKAVERFFRIDNTPQGSEHYTLYFREPLDLVQADKFNLLFYHELTPREGHITQNKRREDAQ